MKEQELDGFEFGADSEELEAAYGNRDTYPSGGIAYVAIKDNEIVARTTVFIMAGGYANISVDTKEEHRKKGLASYLTKKAIEDICNLGRKPIWDCTQDNFASQKTAECCGFEKAYEESVYWFSVEEA